MNPTALPCGGLKQAGRSADFPVRSNLERSTALKNSAPPLFFHAAADWKVRAPSLNP